MTGACAAPYFQRPGFSPEAQAFALMADAAHVRWLALQRGGIGSSDADGFRHTEIWLGLSLVKAWRSQFLHRW